MIGDKLLQEPKTWNDAEKILLEFNMGIDGCLQSVDIHNAKRLVGLNNEVYEKLHNVQFLKQRLYGAEHPEIEKAANEYCKQK